MGLTNCSSINACISASKECIKCPHATFSGKARVDGVWWHWDHTPMFGPIFRSHGAEVVPPDSHPVWAVFAAWLERSEERWSSKVAR